MVPQKPFSKRNRLNAPKEITIREDAPESLRYFALDTVRELGYGPSALRYIMCRVLRTRPDPSNWSEYPNVWGEVQDLMYGCDWFNVYDAIEALHASFAEDDQKNGTENAQHFDEAMNGFFVDEGIGWQLNGGQILTRGTEAFETIVKDATAAVEASERQTASQHLHEALQDLSRRPRPDLPGAIYHAMGALECVARDLTGDPKATLGEILKRHPGLLPKPLDAALSQVWGYASNEARHVEEGRQPSREEAELLVGLSAAVSGYLTRKQENM
jgi:hypothetical protein